ncbi:sugar transferase [Acidipropionibacterium virtanenii]|uniref:Putative sugar transferase EpsL n=1 Tax=Acidipropionibacterium virtanenii TaxID=2057246 RepID=A0A344UX71_9ACTN|nr:sugar transferase [Acidipropionibacterium virtanenii]AXE39869.1 putative sugar transferase EpsL [Acidipropionibacterium virtanenii]
MTQESSLASPGPALREITGRAVPARRAPTGILSFRLRNTSDAPQQPRKPRNRHVSILGVLLTDLTTVTVSTVCALLIRARTDIPVFEEDAVTEPILAPIALVMVPAWLIIIALFGGYQHKHLGVGTIEYRRVLNASLLAAGLLGISAYLLQYPMSRAFYFLMFSIGIPLVLAGRYLMRRHLQQARVRGRFRRRVLVAGDYGHISDLVAILHRERWLGYDVVGLLTDDPSPKPEELTVPTVDSPEHVVTAARLTGADGVIFAEGAYSRGRDFNRLARQLESESAELIVVPTLTDVAAARMTIRPVGGIPLVHIDKPQAERATTWLKRSFDIVGSLLLIIVTSPIVAIAALAIKREDGGPILFKQRRVGMKGEIFECLKLRSMVTNAEEIKAKLLSDNGGVLFKMSRDPRVTRVGEIIRKFSIDEMPQFVNVLRGDMSLVGPRPALENEVAQYKSHVRRRLDVRPGITGLWQVSGRSDLSWDDAVRLDLYYVDNWSMLQDLSILKRTVKAVFSSSGAY